MNGFRTKSKKAFYLSVFIIFWGIICLAFSTVSAQTDGESLNSLKTTPTLDQGGFIYADLDSANNRLLVLIKQGLWQYNLRKDNWEFLTTLDSFSEDLNELEFGYDSQNGLLFLWDRGVGTVYEMELQDFTIKQVDRSHPHRNQFNHQPFFKDSTIYTFGGYGYWMWKNYITYYNKDLKEWSIQNVEASSNVPSARVPRTGVYVPSFDEFFIYGGSVPDSENRADDQFTSSLELNDIWKFSFTDNSWQELNQLNQELKYYYGPKFNLFGRINKISSSFYSKKSKLWYIPTVPKDGPNDLVSLTPVDLTNGNVLSPVLLQITQTNEFLPTNFLFDKQSETVIFVGVKRISNAKNYPLKVVKVSENTLLGKIESPPLFDNSNKYYYLVGVLVVGLLIFIYLRRDSTTFTFKSKEIPISYADIPKLKWLKDDEKDLLKKLYEAEPYLESQQLDELVWPDIDNYDYRRKLRNDTINSVNEKFQERFNTSLEIINRIKDPNDNRRYLYGLNGESIK